MKIFSMIVKTCGLFIALFGANKYHVTGLNEISVGLILVVTSWYILYWSGNEN